MRLLCAVCFVVVAVVAFLLGDRTGYNDGWDEGYSYDCRDELGNVAGYAVSVAGKSKALEKKLFESERRRLPDSLLWGNFRQFILPGHEFFVVSGGCCKDSVEYYEKLAIEQKIEYRQLYIESWLDQKRPAGQKKFKGVLDLLREDSIKKELNK